MKTIQKFKKKINLLINWISVLFFFNLCIFFIYYLFYFNFLSWSWFLIFYLFTSLILSIILLTIPKNKKQILDKILWTLFFIIMPIISHVFFILFNYKYQYAISPEKYFSKPTFKFENKNQILNMDKKIKNLFEIQQKISQREIYQSDIKMITSGYENYDKLFKDLIKAKKYIFLQYFIIKKGMIFDQLKNILIQKASENVEIKFIVDDFGHWFMPWKEIENLKKKNIEIKTFSKTQFPFINSQTKYRFHKKMALIDGKIVYAGGYNISDEYANLSKKYGFWIDTQYTVEGPAIKSFILQFINDWYFVTGKWLNFKKYNQNSEKQIGNSSLILIEDSPEINISIIQNSIILYIENAQKEIIITTPYFVPTKSIMYALKKALLRNVKVKIFIPGKPDKKTGWISTKYYAKEIMNFGAQIYIIENIFLHSKIGLFDKKYAYLGTPNLDYRSCFDQWEIMQLVSGDIILEIEKEINFYIKISKKAVKKDFPQNKFLNKLIQFYTYLFASLM